MKRKVVLSIICIAGMLGVCLSAGCSGQNASSGAESAQEEQEGQDGQEEQEGQEAQEGQEEQKGQEGQKEQEGQEEQKEGAAGQTGGSGNEQTEGGADGSSDQAADLSDAPQLPGLTCESRLDLEYAECFDVYDYQDDYTLIDVHDQARYLLVPENASAPEGLDEDIVVLQKPLDRIYLAATASMSLFDAMDALDAIRFSAVAANGWYIENAVKAMDAGDIVFAGKYSEPDYELLVGENCNLAIQSTMILHSPKVKEMLETLGIPVFIDYSSYESHPLGRTEWIKLYGAMIDKEEEAKAFFDEQAVVIEELKDFENTEKTVAFFYINTDGSAVVREVTDYIPHIIEIAGGRYIFQDPIDTESSRTSVSMTMEEFYDKVVNADYIIYNAAIDNPISSVDELLDKSELFADFKAVKEGNVWCAGGSLYQKTDIVGNLIRDIHLMLTDGSPEDMTFLSKIS